MTGSETQSKISASKTQQLPLTGFTVPYTEAYAARGYMIEGMGAGRYRIKTPKRQRRQK